MRLIFVDRSAVVIDARIDDRMPQHGAFRSVEVLLGEPGGDVRPLAVVTMGFETLTMLLRDPDVLLKGQHYRVAAIVPPDELYLARV